MTLTPDDPIFKQNRTVKSGSGIRYWVIGAGILLLTHLFSFGGGAYVQTQRLKPNADQLGDAYKNISALSTELKASKSEGERIRIEFMEKLGVVQRQLSARNSMIDDLKDANQTLFNATNNVEKVDVVKNVCIRGEWVGVSKHNAMIAEKNRLRQELTRLK